MRKKILYGISALILAGQSMAATEEEKLTKTLQNLYPSTTFTGVHKSPLNGLYEVDMGKNIGYTNQDGKFFIFGHIFDMQHQQDITQQRLDTLNVISFSDLPLKDAIKTVNGNGKRVMAVFSDPDCPYCKKLEQELPKLNNVTIYTFLMPLDGLHPEASKKAKGIWCSTDKSAAWRDYMLHDKSPVTDKHCDSPIERNVQLGQKLGINGTPTLIAANGRVMPGAAPLEQLEKWLDDNGGKDEH
ncbi:MAG: disulfide isomerase [Gallionellales bacterium CG_4_8_14_3_um_filter_54_18]|nr:MAG: disulfide isomerase [Gallionellales bacterium CG_4_8_14_3_um_filter_54_18]